MSSIDLRPSSHQISRPSVVRAVSRVTFWAVLLSGWGLAISAIHVVRLPGRVLIVPKDHLSLRSTLVDTTGWTSSDLPVHRAVVARLVSLGHTGELSHVLDPNSPLDPQSQIVRALTQATH